MSAFAYDGDPRVHIGCYEAVVAGPAGLSYVYAASGSEDWVVAPISARKALQAAHDRDDEDTIRAFRDSNPHFATFEEAVRSLIGDPQ